PLPPGRRGRTPRSPGHRRPANPGRQGKARLRARTFDQARHWSRLGTDLLLKAADGLDDADFAAPGTLPGWSRAHVTAHVAANAEALSNLVHWAATGEPTPMYASPEERAAGIERGRALPAVELTAWLRTSAEALEAGMAALGDHQWRRE